MNIDYVSMGDLSKDLIGEEKINEVRIGSEGIASVDLIESWSSREDGIPTLVMNDETMTGRTIPKESAEQLLTEKRDALAHARRLMMAGKSSMEIVQYFQSHFTESAMQSDPEIASAMDQIGLLGRVYLDKDAFRSCEEMKKHVLASKNRLPIFQIKKNGCDDCARQMNGLGRCPKSSLELISEVKYTPEILNRLANKYKAFGIMPLEKTFTTAQDIKEAFTAKYSEPNRFYAAPLMDKKSTVSTVEALSALENVENKRKVSNELLNNQVHIAQEVAPVLKKIFVMINHGLEGDTLAKEIQRQFSDDTLKTCQSYIIEMVSDPRIYGKLIYYPAMHSSCQEAAVFLKNHKIASSYAVATKSCYASCVSNVNNICTKLHLPLLRPGERIPLQKIECQIDDLAVRRKISTADALRFKKEERKQYLSGLRNAMKHCAAHPATTTIIPNTASAETGPNAIPKSVSKIGAIVWTTDQLKKGVTTFNIREALKKRTNESNANEIISEAIFGLRIIDSASITDCMERKYSYSDQAGLQKSGKCENCCYDRQLFCSKQNLHWVDDDTAALLNDYEPTESLEIRQCFNSPEMDVHVDPPKRESPQIDIADFGQDEGMVLQPPKPLPKDSDPTCAKIYRGSYLDAVDVPDVQYASGLDIEGMSDGMDIGAI